jgi:hypothetical protein
MVSVFAFQSNHARGVAAGALVEKLARAQAALVEAALAHAPCRAEQRVDAFALPGLGELVIALPVLEPLYHLGHRRAVAAHGEGDLELARRLGVGRNRDANQQP